MIDRHRQLYCCPVARRVGPGLRLCVQLALYTCVVLGIGGRSPAEESSGRVLSARNTEVPFSYVVGGSRSWPVFSGKLEGHDEILLSQRRDGASPVSGRDLIVEGLRVMVSRDGFLTVEAPADTQSEPEISITVQREGKSVEQQKIKIRPAPPDRPISYVADLVDDLIRIYWDASSRRFRPIIKDGFDQYFRRLQAQGVTRLIVWQSAFPLIADPKNYAPEDWSRFELQARAILDCEALNEGMRKTQSLKSYQWLGMLMRLRMDPEFDRMFTRSARQHGIRLTASFRPFEAALTKYYEIPAFETDGNWLWGFLPGATPTVNYRSSEVSFAHYREILRRAGKADSARLQSIEIGGISDPDALAARLSQGHPDLELIASNMPPLDEQSFVLVRREDQSFELVRYASIREKAESKRLRLDRAQFRTVDNRLIIDGFEVPESYRYLLVRSTNDEGAAIELPVVPDVTLRSIAGNRLGRANIYCSLNGDTPEARATRVAGIPSDGLYRTEFQAIENSVDFFRKSGAEKWRLGDGTLVIDRGDRWSVEMTDFNRPEARQFVVQELKTILAYDAFDEILINTRSHTQLSASMADGVEGVRPLAHYRLRGLNYYHYGIDRAFAPIALADDSRIRSAPAEQVTTWQKGEWQGPCQSDDSPFLWRLQRNKAIAAGVRALLVDLEREFQGTRIRVVVPESEAVIRGSEDAFTKMTKPDGKVYGRDYYRHVRGSLNHIPAIGEGMAMVDLSGLHVEPVFLGIRFAPDPGPLDAFLERSIEDLADNRGSSFRGAKSFFYEAQETLRGDQERKERLRKRREQIICDLLRRDAIDEVLLYEAADWTYYLPLSDRELSGHAFLDACPQ